MYKTKRELIEALRPFPDDAIVFLDSNNGAVELTLFQGPMGGLALVYGDRAIFFLSREELARYEVNWGQEEGRVILPAVLL